MKKSYLCFDHANRMIVISSNFAKNSNKIGSPEYKQLARMRKDWPDYGVSIKAIETNPDQKRHKGLTYQAMGEVIEYVDGKDSKAYFEFEEMKKWAKIRKQPGAVKGWFFEKYRDVLKTDGVAAIIDEKSESSQQATAASEVDAVA